MRRQVGDVARRRSRSCRSVGAMRPQIRLTKVVLPAPFGPMIARISPGMQGEIDHVDRLQAAEGLAQSPRGREERCHGSHLSHRSRTRPEDTLRKEQDQQHERRPDQPRWLRFQPGARLSAGRSSHRSDSTSAACRAAARASSPRRRAAPTAAAGSNTAPRRRSRRHSRTGAHRPRRPPRRSRRRRPSRASLLAKVS